MSASIRRTNAEQAFDVSYATIEVDGGVDQVIDGR
jgi:hypothetical protein